MDYESRQVKWYWLLLFIVFCGATVYLLFQGNPYLYANRELRSALMSEDATQIMPIPAKPETVTTGPVTHFNRYDWDRAALDPLGSTRSKNYVEYEHNRLDTGIKDFDVQQVAGDQSGFYLTGKSPWVVAAGFDGKARWKFRFLDVPADKGLWQALVDEANVYVVHPSGEVVALAKDDGRIRWVMPLAFEVVSAPFLWEAHVVIPVRGQTGVQLVRVNRADGRQEPKLLRLDAKPGFHLSYSTSLKAMIVAYDNKVLAVDPEDWTVLWTQTLTDPVKSAATIVDTQIFLTTLSAKVIKLNGAAKGKLEWELELEKPAASSATYLPVMQRLSLLDTAGALLVIDIKTGKVLWRAGVEARGALTDTWSARLKGNHIEEFGMDWLHKGWTVWSPCGERRFCIYTPSKGQLIQRVQLSASPLSLPVVADRRLVFLGVEKPGQYVISQALEESETKKLKAEIAKGNSD